MADVSKTDEDILRELCVCNGLRYDRIADGEANIVRLLEMFFSGYPRMLGLSVFPRLETLILIGQTIDVIVGLETCVSLRELWICECKLKVISGLDHCCSLEELLLYSNFISQIENLSHLNKLRKLWLNDNRITAIEGLDGLKQLQDLNLAQNKIREIGKSLASHGNIEVLNLSGNPISSLKDLTNLSGLQNLRKLSFRDPQFAPSPVSLQCNYATHVLYHIPQLTHLDTFSVTSPALKEVVHVTVTRKKLYYHIQNRVLQRQLTKQLLEREKEMIEVVATLESRLKILMCEVKQVERELNDESSPTSSGGKGLATNDCLVAKHSALMERNNELQSKIQLLHKWYSDVKDCLVANADVGKQLLLLELHTGGNIRCEVGKLTDVWYASCCDLIQNGFCATDYEGVSLTGVRVTNVFKIHNHVLRKEFDLQLEAALEHEEIQACIKGQSYKDLLEYFFVVRDSQVTSAADVMHVLEGRLSVSTGDNEAVCLTNNLHAAEKNWFKQLSRMDQASVLDINLVVANRKGLAIVAKVFTGRTMCASQGTQMKPSSYPGTDSVFCLLSDVIDSDESSASNTQLNAASAISSHPGYALWYLFDQKMVLPEYLIEYEYICKVAPLTPRQVVGLESQVESSSLATAVKSADGLDDADVLLLEPVFPKRPRLVSLSKDVLLHYCAVPSLEAVRVLNFHNHGLVQMQLMDCMSELRKLVVSHNQLIRTERIAHLGHLRHLDLSHNKLTALEGLQNLLCLQYLDVSWNQLDNIRGSLLVLRKHCAALTSLDLRHNPWRKRVNLRLYVLGRLKQLKSLDGQTVTEEETASALRLLLSSRVSMAMLLSHSRTDEDEPKSFDLRSTAEVITHMSRNRPERLIDGDTEWCLKITTLNLDSQCLTKLSNLDQLVNLKWASFAHNFIGKVEGLDCCSQLIELSLEDNCISKIEGLALLTTLVRLNLSQNRLTSLDGSPLSQLSQLQRLNVDNNQITVLDGLHYCSSLFELCAANNHVSNTRNAFCLKSLQNFTILDLHGNPVTETENYRLLVIFHLQTLQSLDGTGIEAAECNLARETFGGRLTQDFIADRLGHANFFQMLKADFSHMAIKQVDLGSAHCFYNLTSLNLEHNGLTSFEGLTALGNLKILCLNHNHIESVFPIKPKQTATGTKTPQLISSTLAEAATPVLTRLQVLHLGHNGIVSIDQLQLRLPALQSLFLQANEIVAVDGLHGLTSLRELVLDRNKIRCVRSDSFSSQSKLLELHIEENRLRDLSHFDSLQSLSRLYLGMNRIADLSQLEKLSGLTNLKELSLISNPVSRKQTHRPMLVFWLPQLESIDGIDISEEERAKADLFFIDQLQTSPATLESYRAFQGNWKVGAKVPFHASSNDQQSPGFVSLASYGPQVNALYLQEHITNARSDMTNIITGVDGQLYHGSDHAAFLQPPGVGRQGVNQRYPYTQNTGYDSNPYGSPRQRRPNRRSGPSN